MAKTRRLKTQEKNCLRLASSDAVEHAFGLLEPFINSNTWLASRNKYRRDCIAKLEYAGKNNAKINNKQLAQYIAASAPLHCVDGWGLLGRALDCHSQNEPDAARHLAYYAELRAAMSFFASEGIGIFNNWHFVVDDVGLCHKFPKSIGTHKISWLILNHWAGLKRSTDRISLIIKPYGVPFSEWLTAFGAGTLLGSLGAKSLGKWGLDLKHLSEDRDARNEASYRPTRLNDKSQLSALSTAQFLHEFWAVHEPSVSSRFELLDRHLLRTGLEEAFHALTGKTVASDAVLFGSYIDRMLGVINPVGITKDALKDFFLRRLDNDDPSILRESRGSAPIDDPSHHMQVISRAALLLRMATGSCVQLFTSAGYTAADLQFWWDRLGLDRGLWDASSRPANFTDLWDDVNDSLTQVELWSHANRTSKPSFSQWLAERSKEIILLSSCERIALWGLEI